MQKFKYLLFDLDGTLIKYDLNEFIKKYLYLIQSYFSDKPFAQLVLATQPVFPELANWIAFISESSIYMMRGFKKMSAALVDYQI